MHSHGHVPLSAGVSTINNIIMEHTGQAAAKSYRSDGDDIELGTLYFLFGNMNDIVLNTAAYFEETCFSTAGILHLLG